MDKVCIVGSGFLGTQIGALSARSGYNVWMQDVSEEAFEVSKKSLQEYIQEWVNVGEVTPEQVKEVKQRISYTVDLTKAVHEADIVIEAVVEQLDVKRKVFNSSSTLACGWSGG